MEEGKRGVGIKDEYKELPKGRIERGGEDALEKV